MNAIRNTGIDADTHCSMGASPLQNILKTSKGLGINLDDERTHKYISTK